tara:strand:+ start:6932 stop:7141 length:210 start_codon:yes stop_codon:yes gene_type:complete
MVASEDERKAQIARDMAMLRASGDKNLRSSKENANKIKLTKEVEKRANLLDVAGGVDLSLQLKDFEKMD